MAASEERKEEQKNQIQLHVASDLDYCYRDLFNVFIGNEEVVVEFGNRHRSNPERGCMMNRIVLSVPAAFRLHQVLGQGLKKAQEQIKKQQEEQQKKMS